MLQRLHGQSIGRHLALICLSLLFALPIVWMVLSSLKTPEELARNPYSLFPETWRWQNYPDALGSIPFARYLLNSLVLCTGTVIGATFSSALVAWALAHVNWRGRKLAFVLVMGTMLLPWQVTMVPRFVLIREFGLYDSLGAIILPAFLGEAFFIFLLRQFFLTLPREMLEAGRVDGLSEWGVFGELDCRSVSQLWQPSPFFNLFIPGMTLAVRCFTSMILRSFRWLTAWNGS